MKALGYPERVTTKAASEVLGGMEHHLFQGDGGQFQEYT